MARQRAPKGPTKNTKNPDEDLPLREDIRLLGRLLGDTIRDDAGQAMFDLVEQIRRTAVRYRRDHDVDSMAGFEATISALDPAQATSVVRAFSYFHHLANIAEDLHKRRRWLASAHDAVTPDEESLSAALARLRAAGVSGRRVIARLETARVEPVLTAHPTEVQRKSILERHHSIAARLAAHHHQDPTFETDLRRDIAILWKTSELRAAKPTVGDEIENGLGYFRSTFLDAIPRIYAGLEDALGRHVELAPFLRVGSWIGGDRDGNPHVRHDVTQQAVMRQASVIFEHYLGQIHLLASDLSLSSRYVDVPPELAALASESPAAHEVQLGRRQRLIHDVQVGQERRRRRVGRGRRDGGARSASRADQAGLGGGQARVDAGQRAPEGLLGAAGRAVGRLARQRRQLGRHVHVARRQAEVAAQQVDLAQVVLEDHARLAHHRLLGHVVADVGIAVAIPAVFVVVVLV